MICANLSCNHPFDPKTKNQRFCSAPCANVDHVRRWRSRNKKTCPGCGSFILPESEVCISCRRQARAAPDDLTLQESKYTKNSYAFIRTRARKIALRLGMNACIVCGYKLHIEIAHVKPIRSFSLDTLVSEINDPLNILPFCPTHHWEFDNDYIKVNIISIGKYEVLQKYPHQDSNPISQGRNLLC
jgi:hypothetical protein